MTHELFYTSLPNGLKPGSKDFCTVAATVGISAVLMQRLESLSGYREVYPPGNPAAAQNPVAWSHWRLESGDRATSILSRVCSAGMDHSGRANTFAHHLVLDPASQPAGGPAMVMFRPGMMETRWTGEPRQIPVGRAIAAGEDPVRVCSAWASVTGDAGWAGVLAATAASDVPRIAYLIFNPGQELLPLIREAMALLPARSRWRVCFSTYFTDLPGGLQCHWRCCVAGSPAAKDARRFATSGVVIDLTKPNAQAPDEPLVRLARSGKPETPAAIAPLPGEHKPDRLISPTRSLRSPVRPGSVAASGLTGVAVAQGGVGVDELEPGSQVIGLPGTRADLEPVAVIPTAPAKTNVWLWVVAIVWPLMIIPGVIAWHVTAESQRNRELAKQNSGLHESQEELKKDLAIQRVHATELSQSLVKEKSDSLASQKAAETATTQATRAEVAQRKAEDWSIELQKQLDTANKQLASTDQKAKPAAPQPTSKPAEAPARTQADNSPATNPTGPGPLPLTVVDPFDDRHTLLSPAPNFDRLHFLNPMHIKGFQANDKIPLELRYSDPGGTPAQSTGEISIGTVTLDRTFGLRWQSGLNSAQEAIRYKYKGELPYCGIEIGEKGKIVTRLQFGQPSKTLKLSDPKFDSKNPFSIFSKQFSPPADLKLSEVKPPAGWHSECDYSDPKIVHVHVSFEKDSKATFDVIFNTQTNTFESNWREQFIKLDADIKRERDAENQASTNKSGYEQARDNATKEDNKDGKRQSHIDAANENIRGEKAKFQNAENNAKEIEGTKNSLNNFTTLTIKITHPETSFTMCLLTVEK